MEAMPKKYPPEFKRDVARVARRGDMTLREVAADFDISLESVRRWKRQAEAQENGARAGNGRLSLEHEELERLRKENKRLRMERDILKKTVSFFASESN